MIMNQGDCTIQLVSVLRTEHGITFKRISTLSKIPILIEHLTLF